MVKMTTYKSRSRQRKIIYLPRFHLMLMRHFQLEQDQVLAALLEATLAVLERMGRITV